MLFPTGVIAGLFIAFFRAKTGALITIGSVASFYLWHVAQAGTLPRGPYFALLAAPAVLFLISGPLGGSATFDRDENNREPGSSNKRPEEPGRGLGTAS
jgi:hypothetical protein